MQIQTLHIEFTTACNSRCVMCDYWKIGSPKIIDRNLVLDIIAKQYPLGLKKVYFTGGESLVFAEQLFSLAKQIQDLFPSINLGIITNGLLLKKYYREVADIFSKVIVSLDTIDYESYIKIRGINGVDSIKTGICHIKSYNPKTQVNLRVLVLDETVRSILEIIEFGLKQKIDRISFLPEDTSSENAFGRSKGSSVSVNVHCHKISLPELRKVIEQIKITYAPQIGSLLRHDLEDLERVYSIYSGETNCFPLCNKPSVSCVIGVDGMVSPCFFISGMQRLSCNLPLSSILSNKEYCQLVHDINAHLYPVCCNCSCPKELS